MNNPSLIAFLALISGACFAGASTLFVRLSELGPIGSAFQRVFLAIPFLWIWVTWERNRFGITGFWPKRRDFMIIMLAGVFFAGDLFFWHLAITNTSVANATILATLAPIYVVFWMYILFKEIPKPKFLVGLSLAVVGVLLLIGDSMVFDLGSLLGNIYGVITGIFFAAYIVAIGFVRGRISTASVMFLSTSITALILLPFALYLEGNIIANDFNGWIILLGLAVLSHIGGQGLIAYALAYLPAPFSSVTLILEVLTASILAWLFLSEGLGGIQWFGGGIIILGIIFARAEH